MRLLRASTFGCIVLLATSAWAQPLPAGPEFQVNTHTPQRQDEAAAAIADDGTFLLTWTSRTSPGSDDDASSIQARLFAPDGTPVSDDFQVNSHAPGGQWAPSVLAQPGGEFVVAWADSGNYPHTNPSIRARRIAADGSLSSGDFPAGGASSFGSATDPELALTGASGEFVVAWNNSYLGFPLNIWARLFTADGAPSGPAFEIGGVLAGAPDVAADAQGNFLVVWQDSNSMGNAIFARRYDAQGAALSDFMTLVSNSVTDPAIAMEPSGEFFLAWQKQDQSVDGMKFSASGAPLGSPVTLFGPGFGPPDLVKTETGYLAARDQDEIMGQLVDGDGALVGANFPLSAPRPGFASRPQLAAGANGRLLGAWDRTLDGDSEVWARRLGEGALCTPSATRLCLRDDRFAVEVTWETPDGGTGPGTGIELINDSGYFWFFTPNNVELIVKVLDACTTFDRFWFFAGGLTNVEVDITVTDMATGEISTYNNPQGQPFQPIQDTSAFMTCP